MNLWRPSRSTSGGERNQKVVLMRLPADESYISTLILFVAKRWLEASITKSVEHKYAERLEGYKSVHFSAAAM
jgi:hypothetical protein